MNEFKQYFEIGDEGVNRFGIYTVLDFDADGMQVRYHNGLISRLANCKTQLRIMENMLIEMEYEQRHRELQRGYTVAEEDIDDLVDWAYSLLVPELRRREDYPIVVEPFDILREAKQEISGNCCVYAILLSELSRSDLWAVERRRGGNSMPCIYVGQTAHSPEERFEKHKSHVHSSYVVRRYGLALLPEIYNFYHSLSRAKAMETENALIMALSQIGCTVYGH